MYKLKKAFLFVAVIVAVQLMFSSGVYSEQTIQTAKKILGDLNGDLQVNSSDYYLLSRYQRFGISDFIEDLYLAADLNGDLLINNEDCTLLKRYVLGTIEAFPQKYKDDDSDLKNEITFAHFNRGEAYELAEAFMKKYPEITVNVQVINDVDYMYQGSIKSLIKYGEKMPDVFAAESTYVKEFVNLEGGFEDLSLSQYNTEALKADLVPFTVDVGTDNRGRLRAIAREANSGAIGYKRDIAMKYLGTDDPDKIADMLSTPEKMIETARRLKQSSGGKVKLFPGFEELMRMYIGARSSAWIVDNKLVVDPKIEELVDIMKTMKEENLIGNIQAWHPAWSYAISDDINFAWAIPAAWGVQYILRANDTTNYDSGRWAIADTSLSFFWGGTWFGISQRSENKELAWKFIRFITCDYDFCKESALEDEGFFTSNLEVINDLASDRDYINKFINQNIYECYKPVLDKVNGNILTEYDELMYANLRDNLKLYMEGAIEHEEILDRFRRQAKSKIPGLITDQE